MFDKGKTKTFLRHSHTSQEWIEISKFYEQI